MGQIELLLMVLSMVASFVSSQDPPGGYYHTKYDYLDVEDVLNHKRLVHHYAACLLNRGPCPPQGADLKRILPEALATDCLRCTEKQKEIAYSTVRRLQREYPIIWKELTDLWDPTREHIIKLIRMFDKNYVDDEANMIINRFGDAESGNDLMASVKPVAESKPYEGVSSTTARPASSSTTRRPVKSTTATTTTTTTATRPVAITTTTRKLPQPVTTETITTKPPSLFTRWKLITTTPNSIPTKQQTPYGWRPTVQINFRPQQTLRPFIPMIDVNTGVQILGTISDIGSRVLKAGSEMAGAMLKTMQAIVGQKQV